jgi:4-hydroxy-2-oxoheptanedioate aldolase
VTSVTEPQRAKSNSALARLRSGEPVFGAVQTIAVPTIAELAVWCGFDFVVLDCEHSAIDEPGQLASLQAISRSEAFSAVRVRPHDLGAVGRYLDFGTDAILMPDVHSAEAAAAFVAAGTVAPRGTRSSTGGGARAKRFGLVAEPDQPQPLLVALIEGSRAVERIDEIAAVEGLGGLVIGPYDLLADLGGGGDFALPAYQAAFAKVETAALRAGLILGSRPHPGYPLDRLIAGGHRLIVLSADILALRDGFKAHFAAAREPARPQTAQP